MMPERGSKLIVSRFVNKGSPKVLYGYCSLPGREGVPSPEDFCLPSPSFFQNLLVFSFGAAAADMVEQKFLNDEGF